MLTIANTGVERPGRDLGNAWIWVLALGAPMFAAVVIDRDKTAVSSATVVAYGTVSLACFALGVHHYRPVLVRTWVAFGSALSLLVLADFVWYVISPSIATVIYIAGYCCYGIGLALAAVALRPRLGRGAFVDAALLSCAALAIEWKAIVEAPGVSLTAANLPRFAILVVYPVIDAALLALTLSLLFWAGTIRRTAGALLLCALGLTFLFDGLAGVFAARDSQLGAAIASAGLTWGYGFFAAAALHPTMRDLFARRSERRDVSPVRFVLVAAAPLVPTVLLVWDIAAEGSAHDAALPLLTAAAFALSGIRLVDLLTVLRRAALRDEALRRYSDRLAGAEDRDQALRATRSAAHDLLGTDVRLVPTGSAGVDAAAAPVNLDHGERYDLVTEGASVGATRADDALAVIASGLEGALSRLSVRERERAAAEALREQNARLIQLNEIKQSFVSMVSHELRTPLTSIVGYVEFLQEGEGGTLTDEQARFVSVIERNAGRLQQLVDDILQLGRADEGRITLNVEPVDLAGFVRRAAESADPGARRKGLTLEVRVDPELPELAGDRRLLAQALDNLVSNAIKFTPAGGTVRIRALPAREGVELEVQDSGVGIPADELPHLFERFFRASTAIASGTGLGLSIAQSIAELHGGMISVESTVGVGSTFRLWLPLAPPATRHPTEKEKLKA